MRWAQRFGYGGVGPSLYGAAALPGFWAFLISTECFKLGSGLEKEPTMEPVVNFKAERKLFSKDHPPFVSLHQQKLIYISKEAGEILDISNPAWPLYPSPAMSGNQYLSLPVISSEQANELLALIDHARSHLHLSRMVCCYLQWNKPDVATFVRWALRELIPQASGQKTARPFTRNGLQLMGLEDEEQHRQVLVIPGGIEAKIGSRISGIDDEGNPIKGGEPCQNH